MLDIIPTAEEREQIHQTLRELPENNSLYKCHGCKKIFDIFSGGEGVSILIALSDRNHIMCPECKSDATELMCKIDSYSMYIKLFGEENCRKGIIINGTDICPICKTSMCPTCFNHSVVSLSRVTGYVQDVGGWNEAKKQELLDRKRYVDMSGHMT